MSPHRAKTVPSAGAGGGAARFGFDAAADASPPPPRRKGSPAGRPMRSIFAAVGDVAAERLAAALSREAAIVGARRAPVAKLDRRRVGLGHRRRRRAAAVGQGAHVARVRERRLLRRAVGADGPVSLLGAVAGGAVAVSDLRHATEARAGVRGALEDEALRLRLRLRRRRRRHHVDRRQRRPARARPRVGRRASAFGAGSAFGVGFGARRAGSGCSAGEASSASKSSDGCCGSLPPCCSSSRPCNVTRCRWMALPHSRSPAIVCPILSPWPPPPVASARRRSGGGAARSRSRTTARPPGGTGRWRGG